MLWTSKQALQIKSTDHMDPIVYLENFFMGYIFQKREAAEEVVGLIMFLDRKHKLHKEPVFKGLPKHCKAFSVAERNTWLIIERSQCPLGFYFQNVLHVL